MSHIRRFCRSKENFLKEKKDILIVFEKSENENVLKKRKIKIRNFNYFFNIILRLLKTDSTEKEINRYKNIYNDNKRDLNIKE